MHSGSQVADNGSNSWVRATHIRDPSRVPGLGLQSGPTLAVAGIWGHELADEGPLSVSLCLIIFQMNKTINTGLQKKKKAYRGIMSTGKVVTTSLKM